MSNTQRAAAPSGRTAYRPGRRRRILFVFPGYAPSFGTFQYAYKLFPDVTAFMPPQGPLLVAAYLPNEWEARFVDENRQPATAADVAWADAVFISGMHVQRHAIDAINTRAHRYGKLTVLGGPSVSASPEYYPDVDILHLGELGDATDTLIRRLDESVTRPLSQQTFRTRTRLDMDAFPVPAYETMNLANYFIGSLQFSSGCPYQCEFCDIPSLYGRKPRLKTPAQVCSELDALVERNVNGAIYFVDDNFVGNKKAARELLPHLVRWQEENNYPLSFACEATLNMAKMPNLLEMMRAARFDTVFVGIETPEPEALAAMKKKQNLSVPVLDAVQTLNGYGMEVVSGIIMGLDSDTPNTGKCILDFVEASHIPMLTINLLYALPKTPLYARLAKEGRVFAGEEAARRMSNVKFRMPYEQVVEMWYETITEAYDPARLFERFRYQTEHTFPHRGPTPDTVSWSQLKLGLQVVSRTLWYAGVAAEWRNEFWSLAWPLLRQGRIEEAMHIGVVVYHLLRFTRALRNGEWEACFYADPNRSRSPVAA